MAPQTNYLQNTIEAEVVSNQELDMKEMVMDGRTSFNYL